MLVIRRATEDDWADLYAWRNDPVTREAFFSADPVDIQEHIAWFKKTLQSDSTILLIAKDFSSHASVGMLRLDRVKSKWSCSIVVDANHRGRGVGTELLQQGITFVEDLMTGSDLLVAQIKDTNYASLRLFSARGFTIESIGKKKDEGYRVVTMEFSL